MPACVASNVPSFLPHISFETTPHALSLPGLMLHYQPQVRMSDRRIFGYEALLRFRKKEGGFLSPEEVLNVLTRQNLHAPFMQWLLHEGIKTARTLPSHITLSLNICATELNSVTVDSILRTLERMQCPARQLCIEITETKAPPSFKALAKQVLRLRSSGVNVSLDDFGTGHATLNYVAHVDLDCIKIDQSYIKGIDGCFEKQDILANMLDLIDVSDAQIIAEGIETFEEAECLQRMGLALGQGYFYGRPQPYFLHTQQFQKIWPYTQPTAQPLVPEAI